MTRTLAPKPTQVRKPEPTTTRKDSNRDLVEQVVVALILAFLIRGFEAEAFVIPTGSMAPTLMGRHKEVVCPQCGETYPVNASDEVDGREANLRVVAGTCPNCHYHAKIDEAPSFKGDRILVMKFLYSLPFLPGAGGPKRWDVVVFKYPEEPEINYIKRLVGLPNDLLRVYFGDILTHPLGSTEPFHHERRPLEHQQAMQMLVWDDSHRPKAMDGMPEWLRWRGAGGWGEKSPGIFVAEAKGQEVAELRYRHLVPDPLQWEEILTGRPLSKPPRPTLINDFYSYNSNVSADRRGDWGDPYPPHWVGDLTLSCRLEPTSATGQVRLELVEGGVSNRCEIDLATGLATLYHGKEALGKPAPCGIKGIGSHDVAFANVDGRLTLWVDRRTPFGEGLVYSDGSGRHPAPTALDLDPAGIAAQGASLRVSGLVLKRDIYYTQEPGRSDYTGLVSWPLGGAGDPTARAVETFNILGDPTRFPELGNLKERDFAIRPGHYMMMGDNSPRSKDGRGWEQRDQLRSDRPESGWDPNRRESWEVPESLLIGKAFYVYWPHGKPFGPDLRIGKDFRVPFRPYFERMKWIR